MDTAAGPNLGKGGSIAPRATTVEAGSFWTRPAGTMVCTKCGTIGVDARPNWQERAGTGCVAVPG